MRIGLFIAFFLSLTFPALAWQHIHVPTVDTMADKKELVPFSIKMPPMPLMPKDTARETSPNNKNLLAFPSAVRSLETNWGFGGIAARFFKTGAKNDTAIRTSDVNV